MTKEEIQSKIKEAFGKYEFVEDGHYYLYDGKRVGISTTGLIAQYENEFDEYRVSLNVANKRGATQEEILEEWRLENLHSTIKGNHIHLFAQSLWLGEEYDIFDYSDVSDEIDKDRLTRELEAMRKQAIKFYEDYKDRYELVGCEVYLGIPEYDECGATDLLLYNKLTEELAVIDFKSNKEIKRESYKHQKMLAPLDKYDDCNYTHYSLQLWDYSYKIEYMTGIVPKERFIVYFNCNADDYEIIEPINVKKDVIKILEWRKWD